MTTLQELMDLERGFWLEGADYYRQHLADDFVMLFPGVGPMQRKQAIEGISSAEPPGVMALSQRASTWLARDQMF